MNFDQNFEQGNHFVELAGGSQANNIMKKGDTGINLRNSKGHIKMYLKKCFIYTPTFKQNIFSVQVTTKKVHT